MDIRGARSAAGHRFGVIVSRFNEDVTEGLLAGAIETLEQADVSRDDLTIVRVPGAFEIPLAAMRLAEGGAVDAVICLGCLIKGDTMHFEYIASAASEGIMHVSLAAGIPVAFGVLTTMTDEQAEARSRPGPENKGREAALAAIEMVTLLEHPAFEPAGHDHGELP